MDREVLSDRLDGLFQEALAKAMELVEKAPDGQWIAATEWPVREVFLDLARQCYQEMLQARIDSTPAASRPPFSPGSSGDAAEQRDARRNAGHRRR
jgi:hypothetical protein